MFSLAVSLAAVGMYTIISNYYENKYSDPEPEIEITSVELADAYADDPTLADSMYNNKVVRITGTISSMAGDTILYTVNLNGDIYSINCNFDDASEIEKLSNYSPGDEIEIIGKIHGIYLVYISIDDCRIE